MDRKYTVSEETLIALYMQNGMTREEAIHKIENPGLLSSVGFFLSLPILFLAGLAIIYSDLFRDLVGAGLTVFIVGGIILVIVKVLAWGWR